MKDAICFENNKNIIFHRSLSNVSWNLLPGEVHLWMTTIDEVPEFVLSPSEQIKLSVMKLPAAARRFESTRKFLGYLLSSYLKTSNFQIDKTEQGKPFLPEFSEFHFNVTHSKGVIMVALSQKPIGIDLERRRELDAISIAKRFFSSQELLFFHQDREDHNQQAFFKCWAAKEAALKADGGGIAVGMKENIAVMEKGNIVSIYLRKKVWNIFSWNLWQGTDCFFGAVATSFIPTVIHWHDWRVFGKTCDNVISGF